MTGDEAKAVDGLDVYGDVFRHAKKHDISLYGYLPTGYFRHDCNQIGKCQTWARVEAQVKTYFARLPDLKGIFFDETAPADYTCDAFAAEYEKLRTIVAKYRPGAKIIFNVGMPDTCAVNAAKPGEMVVLFENDGGHYIQDYAKIKAATRLAAGRGVPDLAYPQQYPDDRAGRRAARREYLCARLSLCHRRQRRRLARRALILTAICPAYWKTEVKALTGARCCEKLE